MNQKHIIYIDGDCIICNKMIAFVIKRDKEFKYLYCPLQSDYAKKHLPEHLTAINELETVVLQDDAGRLYTHAEAVFKIVSGLGGIWKMTGILEIVPNNISNCIYRWFARRRYLFGSKKLCEIPDNSLSSRIIS